VTLNTWENLPKNDFFKNIFASFYSIFTLIPTFFRIILSFFSVKNFEI
jgi:hypothetical protein